MDSIHQGANAVPEGGNVAGSALQIKKTIYLIPTTVSQCTYKYDPKGHICNYRSTSLSRHSGMSEKGSSVKDIIIKRPSRLAKIRLNTKH